MRSTSPARAGVAVTAIVAVLATVVSGCSSSGGSPSGSSTANPAALANQARLAIKNAKTFHIHGDLSGSDITSVDVHFGAASTQAAVVEKGMQIRVIATPDTVYFKAPISLLLQNVPASQRAHVQSILDGKWVKEPATASDVAQFSDLTDRATFVAGLTKTDKKPNFTSVPGKTIDGVATTGLKDSANDVTIYVAASGTPYPMEIDKAKGRLSGTITFDGWNQAFSAAIPDDSDVVDASQLGG